MANTYGEVPWTPPLTARIEGPDLIRNHGIITITAAHWVPKDTIGKFYAELKSRVDSAPTPSLRRLAVFRFVTEQSSGITECLVYGLNTPRGAPYKLSGTRNTHQGISGITATIGTSVVISRRLVKPQSAIGRSSQLCWYANPT
jgi:hypothetical protein